MHQDSPPLKSEEWLQSIVTLEEPRKRPLSWASTNRSGAVCRTLPRSHSPFGPPLVTAASRTARRRQ